MIREVEVAAEGGGSLRMSILRHILSGIIITIERSCFFSFFRNKLEMSLLVINRIRQVGKSRFAFS